MEMLRQFEPDTVLDVGMFLKRTGAIARSIGDLEFSDNIVLDGVDFAPQIEAKVYGRVYDGIETWQDFRESSGQKSDFSSGADGNLEKFKDKKYTLAFLMRCENFLCNEDWERIFEWLGTHVEIAVISGKIENLKIDKKRWQSATEVELMKLETDEYCVIRFSQG
jgi:hypothetical protein